jgi:hypothetical protein
VIRLPPQLGTEIRESSASVRSNPPEAPSDCKTNCKTGYKQFENYSHKIKQLARKMVGVRGFEPPAPSSRTRCATRLHYTPPRRRSFSPAATCIGVLIAAPCAWASPMAQTACSLRSLRRRRLGTSCRAGMATARWISRLPLASKPGLCDIRARSGTLEAAPARAAVAQW